MAGAPLPPPHNHTITAHQEKVPPPLPACCLRTSNLAPPPPACCVRTRNLVPPPSPPAAYVPGTWSPPSIRKLLGCRTRRLTAEWNSICVGDDGS